MCVQPTKVKLQCTIIRSQSATVSDTGSVNSAFQLDRVCGFSGLVHPITGPEGPRGGVEE
jgi:hypothetical protein